MTRKQTLVLIANALECYRTYLYNRGCENINDIVRSKFADIKKYYNNRYTMDNIIKGIRRDMVSMAPKFKGYRDIYERKQKALDKADRDNKNVYDSDSDAINAILKDNNLALKFRYMNYNSLVLESTGDRCHRLTFSDWDSIPASFNYIKPSDMPPAILLRDDHESTLQLTRYLSDTVKIVEDRRVLDALFKAYMTARAHDMEIAERKKAIETEYTDAACAIVYKELVHFAKDTLDTDLPATF
jgi:hypothetical protein